LYIDFGSAPEAVRAWEFAFSSLYRFKFPPHSKGSLENPRVWSTVLFNNPLPSRVKKLSAVWSLLKGVTLWAIWIERNELVFNDETLPIKNKPKHKKRGNTRNKWKDPRPRRQKNHLRW
jgi:hypothetical protein